MRYTTSMALRRKILLGLLILPAVTALAAMVSPGAGAELFFLVIGVPILVLNAWEFFLREEGNSFFDLSQKPPIRTSSEGSIMKSKPIAALIIVSAVFFLLILGYTWARSVADQVPYTTALYFFLIKLGTKLYHLISIPVIFIALLLFIALLVTGPMFLSALKKTRDAAASPFPDVYGRPVQSPFAEIVPQAEDNQSILAMERMIGEGIDLKAIQLLLEIDGIDLTKPYLLSKVETLGIHSEGLPANANAVQKEAFYQGVVEGLVGYLFPLFGSIETKNEAKAVRCTLKPGVRDTLMERFNQGNRPPETMTV